MKTHKTFNWSRFFTTSGYIVIVVGVILLSVSLYHQIQANEHLTEENAVIISGSTRYSDSTALGDASRQTTQKILFISSYDPTNAYYQDQITGMLSVSDTNNIEFDVVNMDAAKHKSQSAREIFDQDIRHCLASDHYSGVIVAGDPALKYVMSHQDENFKDLPVVFYGVVNRKLGKTAAKDPRITGYLEADHVANTIDMARTLLPGTKRVVAIHDNSAVGVTYGKVFNRLSKNLKYTGLTFETLNLKQYTSKSLKKVVAKYKKGTVLLLMSAHVDQNGNYYTSPEITRIVSSAASVPVFRNGKGGYNNGAVAGQVSDYMKTAAKAVRLMHNVLTGKVDLARVGVTATNADAIDVASYKAMQKFHLDFDALPDHTMLIGAPNSYYRDSHRPVIYALVVVLAGFAMIFAGSRFDIAKRKHTEKRLQRLTEHLREASRHDPLTALYTRQTAGKRLDALDQQGKPYAIVTIDLDNFKDINEIYGHRAGDRLIQVVALELRDLAEANGGVAARYSGDSFILFFPNRQLQEDDAVLRRIQGVFKRRRTVDHNTITLQASISAANSEPDMPYKDVLLWCETAMQIGKRRGKNTCVFYGRQMKADAAAAEAKRAAVLSAIQHDGFTMVYQPQV
jgi:diguanylate cyclase (GGDEF)-like protein